LVFKKSEHKIMMERFLKYADAQGLELLHDDKDWLTIKVKAQPIAIAREFLCNYIDTWKKSMRDEIIIHRKQNAGRYAANTQLREST